MGEKRVVMKVTVSWVTDDNEEAVEEMLNYLDLYGPNPVDWVSEGLHAGAKRIDFSIATGLARQGSRGFEILVEGPGEWRASHDTRTRGPADGPA